MRTLTQFAAHGCDLCATQTNNVDRRVLELLTEPTDLSCAAALLNHAGVRITHTRTTRHTARLIALRRACGSVAAGVERCLAATAERSAARLAHQSGGLGVAGSNPAAPTTP